MKVELETLVWRHAVECYGACLISIVSDALASYRRKPGLDSWTRIYKQDVGAAVFSALRHVLPQTNLPRSDTVYIHVRQQLRTHVCYHVLKRLIADQHAPAELREHLLAIDLGI